MKAFLRTSFILLVILNVGCNEENISIGNDQLAGEWFYLSDRTQTLNFVEPGIVNVNGNPFNYEILENDILELSYSGPAFILLPTTQHSVKFDDNGNILQFSNLANLHFFTVQNGEDEFER